MSKAARDLARYEKAMVEVDGEFCIPQEENEARYYIDLGPILGQVRSAWALAGKLLLFVPAMFLFILAIQLMKAGAAAVGPEIQGQFPFANGLSTMGTGWLGAYLVLSGSPVAATAISLFGAGTTSVLQTFTMLSGSRLGASFIVLRTRYGAGATVTGISSVVVAKLWFTSVYVTVSVVEPTASPCTNPLPLISAMSGFAKENVMLSNPFAIGVP